MGFGALFFLSRRGGEQKTLAQTKKKGTQLKVLRGKAARLNFVIFLILYPEGKVLASYDIYKEVRATKGFRNVGKQNVDRRVKTLHKQHWIETQGERLAKAHFLSPLYKLSVRGRAAVELSKKDLDYFLQNAPEDQLQKLVETLRMYL